MPAFKPVWRSINITDPCYTDPTADACKTFARAHMGEFRPSKQARWRRSGLYQVHCAPAPLTPHVHGIDVPANCCELAV